MNETLLLPLLVIIPLLGALALMLMPVFRPGQTKSGGAWRAALINAVITLVIALLIAAGASSFNWLDTSGHMQLTSSSAWISTFGLLFAFGIDALSMWMILLTAFLMPLIVLASRGTVKLRDREFYFWLLVLQAALFGVFTATDLLFFYLCFEATLIPLFFLIGIHGGTRRRSAAAMFFLYTFVGSVISLGGLLYVAWWHADQTQAWSFNIAHLVDSAQHMGATAQMWVMLALMAGFAVKLAVFPFHSWKPLSYEEAPTVVSAVLGGLLLQLGLYGIVRFVLPMTPHAVADFAMVIGTLGVIGILYGALIARVQHRFKLLIAYASISHVGFAIVGLFSGTPEGIAGGISYVLNQGLITAALFLCVGMLQHRFGSEDMRDYSGLGRSMPIWSSFMLFFALASVGVPGLNGFVGEFLSLLGAFKAESQLGPVVAIIAGIGIVLAAVYVLYMVGGTIFGPPRMPAAAAVAGDAQPQTPKQDLTAAEITVLLPIAAVCLLLGLLPNLILTPIEGPVDQVARRYGDPLMAQTNPLPNLENIERNWQAEDQRVNRDRLQLQDQDQRQRTEELN